VTSFMIGVVEEGTGSRGRIPGVAVAGKTGTAQAAGGPPHAWFIAFAPANAPRYAVSVIVEGGNTGGTDATGGAVAAPIAHDMLQNLLASNP
jgi:penicillin-binding protein A